jgi:Na+-transporting methylmalonyl-CoA/oxaloacetate decarboxylase gamma subunit
MMRKKRAQISLELGLAFILIFMLLLAGVKLSVWLIGRMVDRQEDYERSRAGATYQYLGAEVNESNSARYKPLKFFGSGS